MAADRRYDEDEVQQLLARAMLEAERDGAPGSALLAPGERPPGLSLAQVTEIAQTVGIPPEAVARASAAMARGDHLPTTTRRAFGIPIGVARHVNLPRALTDVEWDRLVIRLREMFGAEGRVTREGTIRTWRNGNLRVALEPTADGQRLRLSTMRTDAPIRTQIGVGALSVSALMAGMLALTPAATMRNWGAVAMMAAVGTATLVRNVLMLPRWAKERARQMEALGAEVGRMLEEGER